MGTRWVLYRLWYAAQKRAKYFRWRTRAHAWEKLSLSKYVRSDIPDESKANETCERSRPFLFFFGSEADLTDSWHSFPPTIAEAESILGGQWRYFGGP